jgi:hypothetical protein
MNHVDVTVVALISRRHMPHAAATATACWRGSVTAWPPQPIDFHYLAVLHSCFSSCSSTLPHRVPCHEPRRHFSIERPHNGHFSLMTPLPRKHDRASSTLPCVAVAIPVPFPFPPFCRSPPRSPPRARLFQLRSPTGLPCPHHPLSPMGFRHLVILRAIARADRRIEEGRGGS